MRICVYAHDCTNVSKFLLCKKNCGKISPTACIGEIGENVSPGENFHVHVYSILFSLHYLAITMHTLPS